MNVQRRILSKRTDQVSRCQWVLFWH